MTEVAESDSAQPAKTKKQAVKIREMTIDDLADVFHLGEQLFVARKAPNTYRAWDEYEVADLFYSDTEFCLVAEHENEIIGFALGTTVSKNRSAWKYGYLLWLGVLRQYQRSGIAERLFYRFKSIMLHDGVRILVVDTEADNRPAISFFEQQGFGNPQQHVYLTMNLDQERQRMKKRENGH
ncbi:MAG: GNAT family N-acetyltransferase [Desulfobacterales bacterium]|nr:GNAT family N-acetyltransferase [Desulfobacterales bacterium]